MLVFEDKKAVLRTLEGMQMIAVYNNTEKIISEGKPGVGLGNFDGLHIGHMTLINTLISECKFNGLDSLIYTFTKHPENILRKKLFTPLLTTEEKKTELLKSTPLNHLYFDEFDEEFSRISPENFVKNILVERLGIKLAVAGFDYRFGYKGEGDGNLLKELGKIYNYKVIIIPPVQIDGEIISSTLIRNTISKGNMDKVFKLLGRHYSVSGKVEKGRNIGSTIGFPTANIHPEDYLILPQDGVYITKTLVDGQLHNSITNIGNNPTFGKLEKVSLETHLLDFNKNIYNECIEVFFISKIRGEKKFRNKQELIVQINKDITRVRDFLK